MMLPETKNEDKEPLNPTGWLVRISETFAALTPEILQGLGGAASTRLLGNEYHVLPATPAETWREAPAARFVRWNLPVHHSWPCRPPKIENFVERAAQALARKFAPLKPQTVLIGALAPVAGTDYYKSLASNLRGRVLQLFPPLPVKGQDAEAQDAGAPTLFVLVGKEGLFAGLQSPRAANGFYPGGTKFISQSAPGTISRAGAKIAEALHHLLLHRPALPEDSHWLELGASPGGMTAELLTRGYRVTAVDRAWLDPRLDRGRKLDFVHTDAADFLPPPGARYDAILSDMNGDAAASMAQVIRLSRALKPLGLVVFTLKLPDAATVPAITALTGSVIAQAAEGGLSLISQTHLSYNRQEFTLFLERP
ncbi:MAG: SAM-dependent methyltransferase [Verrucomicrobiota bacterium]